MVKRPHIKIEIFTMVSAIKEKKRILWVPNMIGR